MKSFKDTVEDTNESIINLKKYCELCGKLVKRYQGKYDRPYKFVFINITQNPANHYFCSKKCKTEWIFKPSKRQVFNIGANRVINPKT